MYLHLRVDSAVLKLSVDFAQTVVSSSLFQAIIVLGKKGVLVLFGIAGWNGKTATIIPDVVVNWVVGDGV